MNPPQSTRRSRSPARPAPRSADGAAPRTAYRYSGLTSRARASRREHAAKLVDGADERGEADVDEIDAGEAEHHFGVDHDTLREDVVDEVEQRRVGIVE